MPGAHLILSYLPMFKVKSSVDASMLHNSQAAGGLGPCLDHDLRTHTYMLHNPQAAPRFATASSVPPKADERRCGAHVTTQFLAMAHEL